MPEYVTTLTGTMTADEENADEGADDEEKCSRSMSPSWSNELHSRDVHVTPRPQAPSRSPGNDL